ncbi:MAG: DUF4058 family protein [Planctomycetes bacterium]|nr:DUF4058 family protein [Planctomycetota bacterium]
MPLLDHFRPPLLGRRHWESFHAVWATEIMAALNKEVLPKGYFAETQTHVGGRIEVDVATLAHESSDSFPESNGGLALMTWAPPITTVTLPLVFPDEFEIQVFSTATGPTLVGAIELVSPGNKDRPEARRAFAAKCASYLQAGIGLVVVDVVTDRHANLHDELIDVLQKEGAFRFPRDAALYAVSYRPARLKSGAEQAETFFYELALDRPLPIVPLPLRGGPTLPLDLESAYSEARGRSRL